MQPPPHDDGDRADEEAEDVFGFRGERRNTVLEILSFSADGTRSDLANSREWKTGLIFFLNFNFPNKRESYRMPP